LAVVWKHSSHQYRQGKKLLALEGDEDETRNHCGGLLPSGAFAVIGDWGGVSTKAVYMLHWVDGTTVLLPTYVPLGYFYSV
jgi:hypothetical protein